MGYEKFVKTKRVRLRTGHKFAFYFIVIIMTINNIEDIH
jgi:hypothetical protein